MQFIFGVFVRRLFALLDQHAVLDSLPPPVLKFRRVLCEFQFVRIRHHHFIQSEIMFTLDELIDHDQTFFNAFEKSVENGKSEGEVTRFGKVVEFVCRSTKLINVTLVEVHFRRIEAFQVELKPFLGNVIVHVLIRQMKQLHAFRDRSDDLPVLSVGFVDLQCSNGQRCADHRRNQKQYGQDGPFRPRTDQSLRSAHNHSSIRGCTHGCL